MSGLLHCLLRYGEWEAATDLSLKVIDATLGRCLTTEFDYTIKKLSAYDADLPQIPMTNINILSGTLKRDMPKDPFLQEVRKKRKGFK